MPQPNSRLLFLVCSIYSVIHLGLMLDAFLSERDQVAYAMIVLHGMLLALYVGPKEAGRWFKNHGSSSRPGEALVFLWIGALVFMGIVNHFAPRYRVPEGMLDTVLTLGVILFGSEMSKLIHGWRKPPCPENEKTTP
ncbi:MAG: hypothetical protein QY323_02900 [Patescibacteria group bacterium]|nr:MAG: hypothetical protein QY323_02900 [Patescibacteria group bacterium]